MTPAVQVALFLGACVVALVAYALLRLVTYRLRVLRAVLRRDIAALTKAERESDLADATRAENEQILARNERTLREIERVRDEAIRVNRRTLAEQRPDAGRRASRSTDPSKFKA